MAEASGHLLEVETIRILGLSLRLLHFSAQANIP